MSEIKIERRHQLGRAEAQRRVVEIEPKLKQNYGVRLEWNGDQATLKGSGVTGSVEVTDTRVEIDLKLGLLLRPMAGKIREALERNVDRALAHDGLQTPRHA